MYTKMIKRKNTKKIRIGNVEIGGDSPVSVQSMCDTDTRDAKSTIEQIKRLEEYGCELVRIAVPNKEAAEAISRIKKSINIPLIADIHFDYRLAIESVKQGIDALRINPGNIGKRENIKKVIDIAKEREIPVRIGINAGSLDEELQNQDISISEKLVKSALKHIKILEDFNFNLIKLSLKSSDTLTMIKAYKNISDIVDYPLHLGVTEAGTFKSGLVKSSIGIGALLAQGIGDTIRVSLTEDPVEEVIIGWEILKSLNLRKKGINLISCPTCGRCQINLIKLTKEVEQKFGNIDSSVNIAVMGCVVNGPGEAKCADIGIAGAKGEGYIFKKGKILRKVPEQDLLKEFEKELLSLINQNYC